MKFIEVKELTETEEKMRWALQEKHNEMQKDRGDKDITTEWNAILLFADYLVSPKKWGVRSGLVILMENEEQGCEGS